MKQASHKGINVVRQLLYVDRTGGVILREQTEKE